jgi:hypothetical protein
VEKIIFIKSTHLNFIYCHAGLGSNGQTDCETGGTNENYHVSRIHSDYTSVNSIQFWKVLVKEDVMIQKKMIFL